MRITIHIQNQQEYQWLAPFLEALKQMDAEVNVKGQYGMEAHQEKRNRFLDFLHNNALKTNKISIPNRDERNVR